MKVKLSIGIVIVCLFCFCTGESQQGAEVWEGTDSSPSVASKGMVSSAHPLATESGIETLRSGGNAFDAAVTIASVLNVVEPMMSGMGGYGTILIYDAKTDKIRFLDSSGKIPAAVDSDVFRAPTPNYEDNRRGSKAVSTPGNVNAWQAMSTEFGLLDWKKLFEPAIRAARKGFAISGGLARTIDYAFESFPEHARRFYGKDGSPLDAGDLLIQEDLARSLELIADSVSIAFYGGKIGKAIDAEMKKSGGFLSIDDLVADKAEWWEPIHVRYRDCEVYTASPPSTAFPSLIRLGLMSRFDAPKLGHNTTAYLHRFAEVTKHAFWCRLAYAGDPEINPPPLDKLLSESYWKEVVSQIDLERAKPFVPPDVTIPKDSHTTHFVVADRWGNIVCATQTLGNAFGSRIMPEGTGIWLNNSLAYCTFEPKGNPMDAHAGHRKLSGDCPTIIVKDGKPWVALGTPGGHTIGQTVPQMVMNLIDFGMNVQEAIAAPRVSFVEPNSLRMEWLIPEKVHKELAAMGHDVRESRGLGNAHGLEIFYDASGKPVRFEGGADPRGHGKAAGY
jgi:gamma-glutamyltranspeptidase/glutathione hydrolase